MTTNCADISKASNLGEEAGRSIKTYTMMTLVIGKSDKDAQAQADYFRTGFDVEACKGMMRAYGFLTPKSAGECLCAECPLGLHVGPHRRSPDRLESRLIELIESCELDGIMLIFPDYLASMPVFADEIMPKIRDRFPEAGLAHAA